MTRLKLRSTAAIVCLTGVLVSTMAEAQDSGEKVSPKDPSNSKAVSVDFIVPRKDYEPKERTYNDILDYKKEALNVSNYITSKELPEPKDTEFDTIPADCDNFRIQVTDKTCTKDSVTVELQINEGKGVEYVLDKKKGSTYRGAVMRLVSDLEDDKVSGSQTILVRLGDRVTVTYGKSFRVTRVGRVEQEDDNGPNQLRHDIRVARVRAVVFQGKDKRPVVSRAVVEEDIRLLNLRFAQSTIRVETVDIDMGGEGDPGIEAPEIFEDGFDAHGIDSITTPTADEAFISSKLDGDSDTIDVFYVESFTNKEGVAAIAYPRCRNNTSPYQKSFMNFIVIVKFDRAKCPYVLGHETMHILLNEGDRNDEVETSLFYLKAGRTTKRISPYPEAPYRLDSDTHIMRGRAEKPSKIGHD